MTTTTAADNLPSNPLPVGLGNTLQLILLLDGVGVAASLGSVDKLLSKALSNRLDVAERGLTGTGCQEGDGLVDTAERGNIDGLSADGTGGTDTGGVFAGTAVDDGVNGNLDRVLVGHEVDDLESVGNNADSHKLLSVVAAVHHQRVGETLNDGAVGLAEALDGIPTSGVRNVDRRPDLDVVSQRDVPDLNILVAPAVEQLDAADLSDDLLGKDLVAGDGLDLDFAVVRHVGWLVDD
jgi:hypothetical protein